jgi:putative DNA primase/helicase
VSDVKETAHLYFPPRTVAASRNGQLTDDVLPADFDLLAYRPEDGGVMDAWLDILGQEWIFITGFNWWYYWNGSYWQKDEGKQTRFGHELQIMMEAMNSRAGLAMREAQEEGKQKAFKAMKAATRRSGSRVQSVEKMARNHRFIASDGFDQGNVLHLENGLLDLDTMEIRKSKPDDLMTYRLPYRYEPEATRERWEQFLGEAVVIRLGKKWVPHKPTIKLLQELAGYSLTKETNHEIMVWLSGMGGNGKTVAITVINHMIGPLAARVNFHQLGKPGNYDMAMIPGKRIIWSTESERGQGISEDMIKTLVSGENILARPIYGHPFEFQPVAKIWWAMNDRPSVKDTTKALWRRLKLIPFDRTFSAEEVDIHLTDKLLAEMPGILNWAIEGLQRLRENGAFTESDIVLEATSEYQEESNPVKQWIREKCHRGSDGLPPPWTLSKELFQSWESWRISSGHSHITRTQLGVELKRLGVDKKRGS